MSVKVMSLVWSLDLPDSQKIVLLALADSANDEGVCWPSMTSLAKKCSKGERTVQGVIKELVAAGHLTRIERLGKGVLYTLHPRSDRTPAEAAPPQGTTQTPAAAADKPSRTIIGEEAKASPPLRAKKPEAFPMPDGVDPQVWADFLTNRKRKNCSNTATAHKRLMADLDRLADAEWPPGRLIDHAAAHGWAGIYDPREKKHERPHQRPQSARPGIIDIARQVAEDMERAQLGAIVSH